MSATAPALDTAPLPDPDDLAVLDGPRRRRWLVPAALGGAALVAAVGWFMSGGDPTYELAAVEIGTLRDEVTAVGTLEPRASVELASELTGTVSEVLVDDNAVVTAGQVLARLDPVPFETAVKQQEAQVASASAQVASANVEVRRATLELDRTQRLVDRGAAAPVELQDAQLALDSARASVASAAASLDQARAALDNARQDLGQTAITAPIDGVVLHRYVDPGQTVVSSMSATAVFEIAADLSALKADIGVDEADVGRIAAGQRATFTVTAWPEDTFEAEVIGLDVAPDEDASVVTYNAELRIDNPDGRLRPGMTATATVLVDARPDTLLVPLTALRYSPEKGPPGAATHGDRVWVLRDGAPAAVDVRLVGTEGSQAGVVTDGLTAGDQVIVGGAP